MDFVKIFLVALDNLHDIDLVRGGKEEVFLGEDTGVENAGETVFILVINGLVLDVIEENFG